MLPRMAGFREPGFRTAGQVDSGGGGGSSAAVDITIDDAGGFYTSTNVEGALQEAYTAINLRAKIADLSSTAAGKGASLIGTNSPDLLILGLHPTVEDSLVSISDSVDQVYTDLADTSNGKGASLISIEDAGAHYTSTTVEGALTEAAVSIATNAANVATNTTNIAANTTAIGLRPLTTDLASHANGKGASTIGLEDAGNFYTTDNVEAALAQLGPLLAAGTPTSLAATLSDAGTTTAPTLINIAHRSSGTPAANFGLTVLRELDSSAKTRRTALAEVTKWTTATDGAETASHTFQLRTAAVLTDTLTLAATSNFPINGSNSAPTLTVGTVGDQIGFYRSSSQELGIAAGGTRLGRWFTGSPGALQADTIFIGPVGSAAAPTYTVNGSTGGSGLYGATDQVLAAITGTNVLTMSKQLGAFKYTAPNPTANFTASTEVVGFDVAMGRTATWGTGALTTQREMLVRKPTYAFGGASTLTNAATVAIEGAPVAGTNATITNSYSLWTQAGTVRMDLADAATTTAPDGLVQRHTTSGTAAAGFGLLNSTELQSAAGNIRRVLTDSVALTVATDAAETVTRTLQTMTAGALGNTLVIGTTADFQGINVNPSVTNATATTPHLVFGAPSNKIGIYKSGGFLCFGAGGTQVAICSGAGYQFQTPTLFGDRITVTLPATTSGVLDKLNFTPAADTGTTASTEAFDANFDLSRTRTWAAGALTTQRAFRIKGPTYAFASASTITSAATFAIESAPAAGSNATITNAYSLWVQAGATRLDGNFGFQKAPVAQQNTTGTATGFTAGAGTAVNDQSTFTGGTGATAYRISDIVLALKNYGWLAA